VLIVLLPSITAVARSEIDDRIPTIFAFMLALLPIALLATRASWAVIVTVGVLSSLSTICTVKYVGVIGDGFPYQTALLAMIITAFYFHAFFNVVDSQSRQLETSATEQNKLKAWASHDPLTGALNRQAMSEKFEQMLQRSRVAEEQLGVIMLDIDRFKSINDQHGHNIGDDVLIRFVKIVGQSTRANDVCLRWGGEEFVVLSLVTSMAALEVLAENLRRQVATARFEGIPPFTCSVGVALHREGESLRQLLGRADEALYQSKKTGRNRVSAALALDLSYLGCWQSIQAHA
jgi:diguanylate cyclase (GGDEF)-like protein